MTEDELNWRFRYHPAWDSETRERHEWVRTECLRLARFLSGHVPAGREYALAITKIEEAMFWANAAIARYKEDTE